MTIDDFLERYEAELWNIAKGLSRGDLDMADELMQRARIKCFERWDSLEHSGVNKWATRVMVFEALMMRRAQQRRPVMEFAHDTSTVRGPDAALHAKELMRLAAPGALSDRQLLLLQGFTRLEISQVLGCPPHAQVRQNQDFIRRVRANIIEHDAYPMAEL